MRAGVGTVAAGILAAAVAGARAQNSYGAPPADIAQRLAGLVRAYPDFIAGAAGDALVLRDGTRLRISDGRTDKSFDELLEKPDIDDMFHAAYPAGAAPHPPARNFDPGRVRFEPLFVAMYGDCRKNEVAHGLRAVAWLPRHGGGKVMVTGRNGVDTALSAVSRELDALPDSLIKYLKPSAGTYNCRAVAGSSARSMHAYGAAIDVNTAWSDYWRWAPHPAEPRWRNRIPAEIVRIFERHGFIWGGSWYHFDTMHFEYRPELLPSAAGATR
jgi:D-alanyl-D-alanine carboxypeptidase